MSSALTPEVVAATAQRYLPADAQALAQSVLRPSLRLTHADGGVVVGRLGGPAMLADGAEWPTWEGRGLEVVAVLDLARLPDVPDLPLPKSGWLTFFYDSVNESAWGFDPAQRDAWRVVHALDATPRTAPDGTETLPEVPLGAVVELTSPNPGESVFAPLHGEHMEALFEFHYALPQVVEPAHRMSGWPDLVQESMWLRTQLASNGFYMGGYPPPHGPEVDALVPGAADWRLLLQVDTDDDAGTMWGDAGRLYFLIRDADAAAGTFDRCWFQLQCG